VSASVLPRPGRRLRRAKRRGLPRHLRPLASDLAARLGWERVGALGLELQLYSKDAGVASRLPVLITWPETTDEVAAVVRACAARGARFTARGAGTGLSGGAVPAEGGVIIALQRMNEILEVDPANRCAWVQPGVVNLDLSNAVAVHGLHFAPDPSSQPVCTIGGNVAENSGGPHCLAYGVTSAHVLAAEVVLPDGEVVMLGSRSQEAAGYDLRGVFVGSEGMCGIATRICVRLTQNPPAVATMLASFSSVSDASRATSAVIAAGIVPAALEMMDGPICRAVAAFLRTSDYPSDAQAVLLVEVDGMPASVEDKAALVSDVLGDNGATEVKRARDAAERDRFWKGRKSAFGAIGRIQPHYYLHDCVIPRTKLVDVLDEVYAIARRHDLTVVNVFHAGDGNLHPLLVFDASEPGVRERVDEAGHEIVKLCVQAGGTLTGEHGVGLEKREYMPLVFTEDDLDAQAKIPRAFDPHARANPDKVFPRGSRCGDVREAQIASGERSREADAAAAQGLWV
jgi:glycolate oxidase subunit GlcD